MVFDNKRRINRLIADFRLKVVAALMMALLAFGSTYSTLGNPRVNQLGYLPNGAKVATLATGSTYAVNWELRQSGNVVASGKTIPFGRDPASGENVHLIDFSSFTTEGINYTLYAGSDQSYPFDISSKLFRAAKYDAIRYFYHNRSGIAIETQYTGGGNGSYPADTQLARQAGHINIAPNKGDFNVPCWPGTCNYALDVPKGWYDAGDHGKYVVNGGISVWKLLNLYERAVHLSDNAADFGDGTLNIPESGNGVPDILDEVRWQLEFLLAMQVPAGQTLAGMVHHKIHDNGWTGLPLEPHVDPQARNLVPPSVTATLNVAAVGAQCARIWQSIDSAFANRCLTVAQTAWKAALANPDRLYNGCCNDGGGGYGDDDAGDEFYWAAAELYITTGDSAYLSTLDNYEITLTDYSWPDTELPGLISLATVPTAHTASRRMSAQNKIVQIADEHVAKINSTGYRLPLTDEEYVWGSNNVLLNKLSLVGLAYDFTGDDGYVRAFGTALDYIFGRNVLSISYVTGHGDDPVTQPHHRFWAGALNGGFPWAPPGALSGGANDGLEDPVAQQKLPGCVSRPQTCFIDHIDSWSTNEITINWNGILAWALAFYDDYADKSGSSLSSSSSSSSNSSSSSSSTGLEMQ